MKWLCSIKSSGAGKLPTCSSRRVCGRLRTECAPADEPPRLPGAHRGEPTEIRIDLDLAALPAEGVESFIGGTTRVEKDGKKWSGFVTAADLDDDAIHLTVQAVEADAWQPE